MEHVLNIKDGEAYDKVFIYAPSPTGPAGSQDPAGEISLGAGAQLNIVVVILPGASKDISLKVNINGEGAHANISGIYLCPREEKVEFHLRVNHNAPFSTSRQLFKGIVAGEAVSDFHGLIHVSEAAAKTEAYQENHSILLSGKARSNTEPQLEIYTDDVKCSHGATVGGLSVEEQFYMRSRGISLEDAKMLQMFSFLSPVLSYVGEGREAVASLVDSALKGFASL